MNRNFNTHEDCPEITQIIIIGGRLFYKGDNYECISLIDIKMEDIFPLKRLQKSSGVSIFIVNGDNLGLFIKV